MGVCRAWYLMNYQNAGCFFTAYHKQGQILREHSVYESELIARPIRIEQAGALYHVTSYGVRREDIDLDDEDRLIWFATDFGWVKKTDIFR